MRHTARVGRHAITLHVLHVADGRIAVAWWGDALGLWPVTVGHA